MKAIIQSGLCDPGAGAPTSRMARMPKGANGKHDPAFPCRLEAWQPDRKYTIDEIVKAFSLDMSVEKRTKSATPSERVNNAEEIFIPRPEENAIIAELKNRNLYKSPLGSGKHDITCPWVNEHTGATDGGTAYFEPDDNYPIGGFKCQHGHCASRKIRELLDYLSIEAKAASMKPTIRIMPGEIHRIADKAEEQLAASGKHYQRGGLIVTITTDPSTKEVAVKELTPSTLIAALSSIAVWERFDGRYKVWSKIDPTEKVVKVLHGAMAYRHLPVLKGLAHQPHFRPDGTLVKVAGYDHATELYGVFDSRKFNIPDNPTKDDAENALSLLKDILSEFPFTQEHDLSAALSALLTAAVRASLPTAPMFHYRAPQIASGKSFLCKITWALASPRNGTPTTFPNDDDSCRKFLLSAFLRAPAVIEFDNLTEDLVPYKSLCTALTSEFFEDRILQVSKTIAVSTRCLFLSSGNNVSPVQDMVRRCITVNLDPACEIPASRTFKNPNVLCDVQNKREKYVSAALTIIRAWIIAGKPKTNCKTVNGFAEWSDLCRQPLLWLGLTDPTEAMFTAMSEDPERENLGRLLEAWSGCFGNGAKMIRDVIDYTTQSFGSSYVAELVEAMNDVAGDTKGINRKVLGRYIKRNANRIVNGQRFVPAPGRRSSKAWRVEQVSSVLSVSTASAEKLAKFDDGDEIPFDEG